MADELDEKRKSDDDMISSLFPEGKERWVKLKYHNSRKTASNIRLHWYDSEGCRDYIDKYGFEVTSIGAVDTHDPQIDLLLEVRSSLYKNWMGFHNMEGLIQFIDNTILDSISSIKGDKSIAYHKTAPEDTSKLYIEESDDNIIVKLGEVEIERYEKSAEGRFRAMSYVIKQSNLYKDIST